MRANLSRIFQWPVEYLIVSRNVLNAFIHSFIYSFIHPLTGMRMITAN